MTANKRQESAGFKFLLAGVLMFLFISCLPMVLRVTQFFSA